MHLKTNPKPSTYYVQMFNISIYKFQPYRFSQYLLDNLQRLAFSVLFYTIAKGRCRLTFNLYHPNDLHFVPLFKRIFLGVRRLPTQSSCYWYEENHLPIFCFTALLISLRTLYLRTIFYFLKLLNSQSIELASNMRIEETLKTTNHSGANGFQVFIMTTDGNDFPVNGVHANTTVSQLKELIKKKIGDRFRVEKLVKI